MEIGKNIKYLRQQKNMTQDQLADYLGVSYQAVSKWETGANSPDIGLLPSLHTNMAAMKTRETLFNNLMLFCGRDW